ncbi:hypothetical protein RJ639_034286 [Escallonia herrerae]|uniref:Polyprotein n=1 Tax=Escallonia herrerae TaxID=1293975 RepID=A0AA88WU43_9ASTE|nr:hypothetical protein RJ639_034286 [Escallonia herrerae]
MVKEGKGKIEKFNGMNFQWWKMQVKGYLYQKDLYLPLVGEKPGAMNASKWAILDRKALTTNNRGRSPTKGRSRSRGKSKSKGKTIVCWNCNKEGHKKNDCTEPKKKKGTGGRQGDDEGANMMMLVERPGYMPSNRNLIFNTLLRSGKLLLRMKQGTRLIRTVKRTPKENGLAERMNRTIMERARCMRIHADLPLQFWAAAVDTAVYLSNRSPASALNGGIPEEEWLVFGCIAYAHIDKEKRKKLDSKSQKCVFIGYGGDEYGYRLWDYEHNKLIRNRDVIFDESRLYKHRLQEHGIGKENKEYMELDEPEDGHVPRTENPEVFDETTDNEIGAGDQQQVPETLNLRRSSREEYIEKVLRRFNFHTSKPVTTPLAAHFKLSKELSPNNREDEEYMAQVPYTSAVGSLMYAMVSTRPDIAHAVGVVNRFMTNPGKEHWQAVKWILRYLRGTSRFCLCSEGDNIEYVAVAEASKEIIWLQRLLTELGYGQVDCKLWTDSQSAIHLAKNSTFHSRTKHIQLRYHFIRSLLEDRQLNLEKIEGNKNPADMLTNVVDRQKLSLCSTLISLR